MQLVDWNPQLKRIPWVLQNFPWYCTSQIWACKYSINHAASRVLLFCALFPSAGDLENAAIGTSWDRPCWVPVGWCLQLLRCPVFSTFSRHLGHLKLRRWNVLSRHFGDTWAALLLETKHVSAGCYSLDLFGDLVEPEVGFAMADRSGMVSANNYFECKYSYPVGSCWIAQVGGRTHKPHAQTAIWSTYMHLQGIQPTWHGHSVTRWKEAGSSCFCDATQPKLSWRCGY